MKEKSKYLLGTQAILNKSQENTSPYRVSVLGREFIVYPNVFSPKYFYDTEFFASQIAVEPLDRFLEIGPGSGVISVTAALRGAIVTAIDINPNAVLNTKANAKLYGVAKRVKVCEGDLYLPIGQQKFDIIFWNTPFGYTDRTDISILEKAVFDPGYKSTQAFVRQAKKHLRPDGRLLIGFSSTLGHLSRLKEIVKENGFSFKIIAETKSKETYPVKFELIESELILKKGGEQ